MTSIARSTLIVIAATMLGGCARNAAPQSTTTAISAAAASAPAELATPATWAGDIPCADCPAQRVTLSLFGDGMYRMRRVYVGADEGRDRIAHELGRWSRAAGSDTVQLADEVSTRGRWRVLTADRLRLLDIVGKDIDSMLNYEITRLREFDPIAGPMPLRGLYRYVADAASFESCASGTRWPVLIEGEHLALERAWLAARPADGTSRLVTIEAEFVQREPEPGMAVREHLRVTRFVELTPETTCVPVSRTVAARNTAGSAATLLEEADSVRLGFVVVTE